MSIQELNVFTRQAEMSSRETTQLGMVRPELVREKRDFPIPGLRAVRLVRLNCLVYIASQTARGNLKLHCLPKGKSHPLVGLAVLVFVLARVVMQPHTQWDRLLLSAACHN